MHLKEIGFGDLGSINLCQDRDKRQGVVKTVMNMRGISFSRKAMFRGIS